MLRYAWCVREISEGNNHTSGGAVDNVFTGTDTLSNDSELRKRPSPVLQAPLMVSGLTMSKEYRSEC
jgi:hypothetical protein